MKFYITITVLCASLLGLSSCAEFQQRLSSGIDSFFSFGNDKPKVTKMVEPKPDSHEKPPLENEQRTPDDPIAQHVPSRHKNK